MQWRGLVYPVSARSVSFAHDGVTHHLQYRDGEIVEQTGAQSPVFSYTIPMREDIATGPYKNLFTEGLSVLFRDIRTRDSGPLFDPVYGAFTCVPTSYADDLDVNKRDGVDIRVEFKLADQVGDDQQAQSPSLQGALASAGSFDDQIKLANWQQQPSPQGMTDLLSSINTLLSTPGRTIDRVNAAANDLAFRAEKIETTIDKTNDPNNWGLRQTARRFRADILTAQRQTGGGDPYRTFTTVGTMPLMALAATLKLSLADLLAYNPQLAQNPMVQNGTTVRLQKR